MKLNRDSIYISVNTMLIFAWLLLWFKIPSDFRITYLFILPIIFIPFLCLTFIRNKFSVWSWAKAILWVVAALLGIVSFCHSLLDIDITKESSAFYKSWQNKHNR
ncbi:MAG: hypothetical protein V2A66_01620 [Pseudomonadota bacterium]